MENQTPTAPDPRAWLDHVTAQRRSALANLFHYAVRNGTDNPLAVCSAVWQEVHRRLQMARDPETRAWLARVLEGIQGDQPGALAYAKSVIDYEVLPYEARHRIKIERSINYLKQAMVGKPATAAQLSFLRALGYGGELPAARAAASSLIDALRQERGQR